MRIIAGEYKSRRVKPPQGGKIRPTSDKVKGALFNMLEPLEGSRVADFYAGSGNLGIEALSRGAAQAVFVDKDPLAAKLIQENLLSLGIPWKDPQGKARILLSEASRAFYIFSREKETFDILLADPPYEAGVLKRIQHLLMEYPILKPGGILAVEHGAGDTETAVDFPLTMVRQKKYGDTLLTLFK